jgi:hypothetical protein
MIRYVNLLSPSSIKKGEVNIKFVLNEFSVNEILPQNWRRITEEAFGEGNVLVEFNRPLPFKIHYGDVQSILITATRRD